MRLEDQVASLDLSKRLKELGVKQESAFYWIQYRWQKEPHIEYRSLETPIIPDEVLSIAAFTTAELGEMLPNGYRSYYYDGHPSGGTWVCNDAENIGEADSPTEADARAKMLIYLIEKGLAKPCQDNK